MVFDITTHAMVVFNISVFLYTYTLYKRTCSLWVVCRSMLAFSTIRKGNNVFIVVQADTKQSCILEGRSYRILSK